MTPHARYRRLLALDRRRGDQRRVLEIGEWRIGLHGLDPGAADALDRRWQGFLGPAAGPPPVAEIELLRAGEPWMLPSPGEPYRIECVVHDGRPLVWSYNFAAAPRDGGSLHWRAGVSDSDEEPLERSLENLVRYLVARVAVERGGFALHGAGVLREGRAYVFTGRSGSGKSTLVGLSAPAVSLGDDFALTVPVRGDWVVPAVPFDNRERAPSGAPRGWLPLAGIWRLHQASAARIETPSPILARASLAACVAFAWALPDLARALLRQVERFVAAGMFAHLHFRRSPDFWERIDEARRPT